MMLTQLADVARKAGLTVVEVPGWRTRGHGEQVAVRTITCHHTANGGAPGNAPSLTVVQYGRPGLSGPLAHFLLAKNGTVFVVAAGLCYHAGVSLKLDYTNGYAVGIEAEAVGVPGTAGDWPPVQMVAYHRLSRALVEHFGLDVADVRGHKETCSPVGRKSDPDFSMSQFRAAVAAVNLNPKETDMPLTNADVDLIWGHSNAIVGQSPGGALKTTMDRVDADNLQAMVRDGIEVALDDSGHPLTARLVAIESALTAILAAVTAPPAPPAG
jgi:hypothetical protein